VTGHRADCEPLDLESLATNVDTLVVLMPSEIESIASRLAAVLGDDRPSALVSQATTPNQRVVRAPLGRIAAAARAARVEAPSTLVVGDVVNVLSGSEAVTALEGPASVGAVASRV
jgi:siroheme synthase